MTPAPRPSRVPQRRSIAISDTYCHPDAPESLRSIWSAFWANVDASGDCWIWVGNRSDGYGCFWVREVYRTFPAYRLAWELLVGPIPPGLDVDHLCRNRPCVNPDHLEPVTRAENNRRIPRPKPVFCPAGHPYEASTAYVDPRGTRRCRTCARSRAALGRNRKRNALAGGSQ